MLTIRLTRKGKKNQPFFRVVVTDKKRSAKGGRAVEILGYVNPLTKKKSLKKERILHWLKNGAQPSATVHNLLVSEKIIVPTGIKSRILDKIGKGKKIHVARVKKAEEAKAPVAPAVSAKTPAPATLEQPVLEVKPAETAAPVSAEPLPKTAEKPAEKPIEPTAVASDAASKNEKKPA